MYEVFRYNHKWLALERASWIERLFGRYYKGTPYVYWYDDWHTAMDYAEGYEVAHRRHAELPHHPRIRTVTKRSDNRTDIHSDIHILGQQRANARKRRRRW